MKRKRTSQEGAGEGRRDEKREGAGEGGSRGNTKTNEENMRGGGNRVIIHQEGKGYREMDGQNIGMWDVGGDNEKKNK